MSTNEEVAQELKFRALEKRAERLRVLVRVAVFVVFIVVGYFVFPALLSQFGNMLVVAGLSVFATAALANAVVVRAFEKGSLDDFGLGWSASSLGELLIGVAAGALSAGAIVGIGLLAGVASFAAAEGNGSALPLLVAVLIFGALGEELMFHGYGFQQLVRQFGAFTVMLPVGVLFGLMHAGNQGAGLLSIVNTAAWGVLLGYAYLRTRALWLPVGLHFGWNLAAPLLGMNLSGFTMRVTGYELQWNTSTLWSGGDYGIEGSLFTLAMVVVLFIGLRRVVPEKA